MQCRFMLQEVPEKSYSSRQDAGPGRAASSCSSGVEKTLLAKPTLCVRLPRR